MPVQAQPGRMAEKYGKVWLLPYSGTAVFPSTSYTWYDELIISRSRIPDGAVGDVLAPAAPQALTVQ